MARVLEIVDSVRGPEDLRMRDKGGPGCILEQLFPGAPVETSGGWWSFYDLAHRAGLWQAVSYLAVPEAEFVAGRIDLAALRAAIVRLVEVEREAGD